MLRLDLGGWGRYRSRLQFAEPETLAAIMNRNSAGFVLSHQDAALGRHPVLTLPFQLQQPVLVAHHPILTPHSLLQAEHFVQLPRRGPSPVIIGRGCGCVHARLDVD
jgi:hypothetical protein